MRWACERGCGAGGAKTYASAADAMRYAKALQRSDASRVASHPTLSTLPLWLGRRLLRREHRA